MRMRRIVSDYVFLSFLIAETNLKLKLGSGILITVPIPKEHTASGGLIESAIQSALREARLELFC
jgi:pseudouridine-5'-phosphate glycosidase